MNAPHPRVIPPYPGFPLKGMDYLSWRIHHRAELMRWFLKLRELERQYESFLQITFDLESLRALKEIENDNRIHPSWNRWFFSRARIIRDAWKAMRPHRPLHGQDAPKAPRDG